MENDIVERRLVNERAVMESDGQLLTREKHEADLEIQAQIFDHYATSKTTSQSLLNVTAIQGLITNLINIFAIGRLGGFQVALIVLIGISMTLQFVIFTLLVILSKTRTEQVGQNCTATSINSKSTPSSPTLLVCACVPQLVTDEKRHSHIPFRPFTSSHVCSFGLDHLRLDKRHAASAQERHGLKGVKESQTRHPKLKPNVSSLRCLSGTFGFASDLPRILLAHPRHTVASGAVWFQHVLQYNCRHLSHSCRLLEPKADLFPL